MNAAPLFHFPALYIGFRFEISVLAFFHFRHFSFCVWLFFCCFSLLRIRQHLRCVYFWVPRRTNTTRSSDEHTHIQKYHTQSPGQHKKLAQNQKFFNKLFIFFVDWLHFLCNFRDSQKGRKTRTGINCGTLWQHAWIFHVFHTQTHTSGPTRTHTHMHLAIHICVYILYSMWANGPDAAPTYFSCRYYSLDWRARQTGDYETPMADCRCPNVAALQLAHIHTNTHKKHTHTYWRLNVYVVNTAARSIRQHRHWAKVISSHSGARVREKDVLRN